MAYSSQFLRFTWLFEVNGTDEIADTTLSLSVGSGWTGARSALNELTSGDLTDLAVALGDLMGTLFWADYSRLVGVKGAAIDGGGHYIGDPLLYSLPSAISGSATGICPQLSACISLSDGNTVGTGHRGRMFLPHTSLGLVAGTPRANTAETVAVSIAAKVFVTAVNSIVADATTADPRVSILSQAGGGTAHEVTKVRVGNITDTQRKRRNSLAETYSDQLL